MQSRLTTPALLILFALLLCYSSPAPPPASTVTLSLAEYEKVFTAATLNAQANKFKIKQEELEAKAQELRLKLEESRKSIRNQQKNSAHSAAALEEQRRQGIMKANWLLTNHTVTGSYEAGDTIAWHCTLEFQVLHPSWTEIPILGASGVLDRMRVSRATTSDPNTFEIVKMNRDTFILQDKINGTSLATNQSGTLRVDFVAYGAVQSNRNQRMLHLRTHHPIVGMNLQVSHASGDTVGELNVSPTGHHTVVQHENFTEIISLPPRSDEVEVKWMVTEETNEAKSEAGATHSALVHGTVEPQSTVVHHVLHSVGESVLRSTHSFTYTVDADVASLSLAEIVMPLDTRVTSVSGADLLAWHVAIESSNPISNSSNSVSAVTEKSILHLQFKKSVMNDVVPIVITTELQMSTGAETISVSTPECRKVLRQAGTIGVIKVASVEVHERTTNGLARADPTELSSQLRFQTDRPIVLAYKYHTPRHALTISVINHEEMSVLKAVVDKLYYEALVVEDNTMHRMLMTLQTTGQMQYLRINNIPSDATIWSVLVNSVAVKPSKGSEGTLLVPLQAGVGSNNDGSLQHTSIEVIYLSKHELLRQIGNLNLKVPFVDSPVSVYMAKVSIPSRLEANYTGSLPAVRKFSTEVPTAVCGTKGRHMVEDSFDFSKGPLLMDSDKTGGTSMKIELPASGVTQRFERLLVVNTSPEMHISYAERLVNKPIKPKVATTWWQSLWQ